ncbi:MAG: collagen-like protein [Eubacteriales bacterium]|nr:collagen-like protein [Eubacteriales bacterium]
MTLQQATETVTPEAFCNAQFVFDSTWRYSSIWAYLEGNGVAYRMKVENGGITSDNATVLPEGRWNVYLKGENYNENGTLREEKVTNLCRFTVAETEDGQGCRFRTVATPTAEEQTKFLALQALDLAKEVMHMAQAGDFKGDSGEAGPQGNPGAVGTQGPAGINGVNGADGATWYSGINPDSTYSHPGDFYLITVDRQAYHAYDVLRYVDNTVGWEIVCNIKGDKGAPGVQGVQGIPGTNGADGYTPVRGTDYWTAADIATIKGYVDDAILGGAW